MPKWRRGRDEPPEDDFEAFDEEGTEEQPAIDDGPAPDGDDEGWPDWAYDTQPRSSRSRRSKRKRGRRSRSKEAPPLDRASDDRPEDDPSVWVSDDPPADENERWLSPRSDRSDEPVWSTEHDQRLRDLGAEETVEEAEPTVVVEASAEVPAADSETSEDPAYDSRLDDEDAYDEERGFYDYDYETEEGEGERVHQPVIGDVVPGGVGPRRAALHERKRKRTQTLLAAAGVLVLVIIFAMSALSGGDDDPEDGGGDDPSTVAEGEDQVESMLLYGTHEDAEAEGASWIALLSIDRANDRGSVVYIPAHTAVEVPGRGLLPLGEAAAGNDIPLLLASTEAMLGIEIDRYLELSDSDARVLFEKLGALEVDVPAEVNVPAGSGQTQLIFPEGTQEISGDRLGQLLYVTGVDGDDVELGDRHLAFWDSVFETYGGRTTELEELVSSAGDVLGESDKSPALNAEMIAELAALPRESISLNTLPVQQVTVGDDELYNINEEALAQFVTDTIGARSRGGTETRVQILNGNGVPGIGTDVAEKLVGEGFRVILSGNARSLDYDKTLIIAYDRTEEGIALAERAKELLGVGEVQVSGQDQGIVDLTIVVGKDFLGRT